MFCNPFSSVGVIRLDECALALTNIPHSKYLSAYDACRTAFIDHVRTFLVEFYLPTIQETLFIVVVEHGMVGAMQVKRTMFVRFDLFKAT